MTLEPSDRPLFLVGFMGSGKSTVGERVACELERPFLDSDRMIEKQAGKTVREIFEEEGQRRFRSLEKETLASLAAMSRVVAALGGGALEDPETRALLLESGLTIWVDVPLAVIRRRLDRSEERPLWPDDVEEQETLFRARREVLALAPFRVEAGDREPSQVAADVLALHATLIS
jgi:shikimate kinase